MKYLNMMFATAAAVGVNTSMSIQEGEEAVDITEQIGGDIVKKLVKDHEKYDAYSYRSLTEAIIERGKKRVEKGQGCKHVGFRLSDDGSIGQWCEDACIWAGG